MTGHAERPNKAPIKVVGVGVGRTGTSSLATALETLGIGPAYHLLFVNKTRNDFPKQLDLWYKDSSLEALDDLLQGYQCMFGFAAAMHAEALYLEFPSLAPTFEWLSKCLLEDFFGGRLSTNPKQEYLDHIERIKSLIPKEQLLIFDVKEGWAPLTEFLGVTPPEEPFPHVNDAKQLGSEFDSLGLEFGN
ncbi:hypothetical protein M422DRAFT_266491 [Sphaerobolus stellatus SS14]|uniref:Uncharacterized protein n=1 Tax=Sphaerobolus stellatus (strain SS14) TaxID=990650 RepID=A0A0C9URB6_SPHS4|nr:hypothetical protein M422DRAFT_266491 [Sphaerobolus stellatus SS14]